MVSHNTTYMVFVKCMTFNQRAYIEDAMNGFCMQKTKFPFVCIIADDASTDGEQEVIKRYFQTNFDQLESDETNDYVLSFGRHKTNVNCYFAILYLKYNHYSIKKSKIPYYTRWQNDSKYYALCEGDDFWTYENKLQRQVDFLEKNTDCTMCFHSATIKNEIVGQKQSLLCENIEEKYYTSAELLDNWIVPTASILYRSICDKYTINDSFRILNNDIFIVMKCAAQGKVYGMKEKMSVYRIQNNGVTYNKKLQYNRIMRYPEHFECLKENFPHIASKTLNRELSVAYYNRAQIQTTFSKKLSDYKKSFRASPIRFTFTILGIKTILKAILANTNSGLGKYIRNSFRKI